jgi:hypothetical protein
MKDNKTAVKWLLEELGRYWNGESNMTYRQIKDKAKEMEKEQIAEAYYIGDKNGCGCYDYCTKEDSEQYYKETYE